MCWQDGPLVKAVAVCADRFNTAYTLTRLNPQTLAIDMKESPAADRTRIGTSHKSTFFIAS
jgi:hypothetical protein